VRYWGRHPPVHVTVAALARGLGGGSSTRPSSGRRAAASDRDSDGSADIGGLAAVFGPPVHPFRPPCRMQPAQTSAPTEE
jgi:hypothetical protein